MEPEFENLDSDLLAEGDTTNPEIKKNPYTAYVGEARRNELTLSRSYVKLAE